MYRSTWILMIFVGALASPLVRTGTSSDGAYKALPDIQGQSRETAAQILRLCDLRFAQGVFFIAPGHWRHEIRPGVIYLQVPPPKTPVRRGGAVAGWIFTPAAEDQEVVTTPKLTGLDAAAARTQLDTVGLQILDSADQPEPQRVVVDQYPRSGQKVYRGTSVFLSWQEP
jgi:beta-lactam-binding protein with PASTA domain